MKKTISIIIFGIVLSCYLNCSISKKKAEILLSTNEINPNKNVIACIGSSTTFGSEIGIENAFPALMQNYFKQNNINYQVRNCGMSYVTSDKILKEIDKCLTADVCFVILEVGLIDFRFGVSPKSTYNNISNIIKKIQLKKIPILLLNARINPIGDYDHAMTREFNKIYPRLAARYNLANIYMYTQEIYDNWPQINTDLSIADKTAQKIMARTYLATLNPAWCNAYNDVQY